MQKFTNAIDALQAAIDAGFPFIVDLAEGLDPEEARCSTEEYRQYQMIPQHPDIPENLTNDEWEDLQGGDSSEASYELDVAAGELRFNGKTAWRLERA